MTVVEHSDGDHNTRDLRAETQGMVTFYHSLSTPGYWFSAGELEAMIESRAVISLPEKPQTMTLDEEYEQGPATCPRCGTSSKLFEMRSYLSSDVRLRACHVCHGRWVGHESLRLLVEHIKYRGLFGGLKKMLHNLRHHPEARPTAPVEVPAKTEPNEPGAPEPPTEETPKDTHP